MSRGGLFGWLRERLRREIRDVLADDVRALRSEFLAARELQRIVVRHDNPLQTFQDQAGDIADQLRGAANHVGRNVMVGNDVILWGGMFPGGLGLELHDDVRLYESCRLVIDQISPSSGIVLEDRVAMNFGVYIDGSGGVRIRRGTVLGPNVVILSSSHRIDVEQPVGASGKAYGAVDIGEDVWVGANAVIRMGITVGDRAVIGAGSIVTRDVPTAAVVAGNPARTIRLINGTPPG